MGGGLGRVVTGFGMYRKLFYNLSPKQLAPMLPDNTHDLNFLSFFVTDAIN